MSLKVLLRDNNGNINRVYLKREDIKSINFGTDVVKNPNYNPDSEVEQEQHESISVDFCKINFYEKVEVEEPYNSVTKRNGKDVSVIKTRKVMVDNYWAVLDKDQFAYIEDWSLNNL